MDVRELRLECVRIASDNLRALFSNSERPYDAVGMASLVSQQADQLYHYVQDGTVMANLKTAA